LKINEKNPKQVINMKEKEPLARRKEMNSLNDLQKWALDV